MNTDIYKLHVNNVNKNNHRSHVATQYDCHSDARGVYKPTERQ